MIIGYSTPIPSINRLDKEIVFESLFSSMMNRALMMFKYKGLPKELEQIHIEKQLLYYGTINVFHHEGKLYALYGGLGGKPTPYYMPSISVIANPALKLSKEFKIGEESVLIGNDSMYYGLKNLIVRYATLMTENIVTMYNKDIMNRVPVGLATPDDNTYKGAMSFLKDVFDGKLSAMSDNVFLDGIRAIPLHTAGDSQLTSEIEYHQYLKASYFNELGLKSNYNMKRESINSDEAQLDNTSLLPLAYDMLEMRKKGWEDVNEMFGTNITVEFSDIWKKSAEFVENSNKLENDEESIDDSNKLESEGDNED